MLERRIQSLLTRAAGGIYDKMFLDFFFPLFVIYLELKKKKKKKKIQQQQQQQQQ